MSDALSDKQKQALDWIDSQAQHMLHTTMAWSRINSGSYHLEGLARMCAVLEDHFHWLHGDMQHVPLPPLAAINAQGEEISLPMADALRIRKRPEAPLQVVLTGHMDTVFPKDCDFQEPVFQDEAHINGPGVADMKGGLMVMLKALEAFEQFGDTEKLGYEIIINPDEEIGSQSSDFLFQEAAKRCHFGMIYEPALANGTLAGGRKGSGNFTCVVRGVAAHAGREFDKGKNAIVSASKLALALHALNGQRDGVTLNIGKVEGGGALNQVPDVAMLRFNVRVPDVTAMQWIEQMLETVMAQHDDPVFIHGGFTRPPKPMDTQLEQHFSALKMTASLLGMDLAWQATGGCCDGNNLFSYGVPNIDTLGVRGGMIHSDQEYLVIDSLPERSKLSALHLMRLADGTLSLRD